MLSLLTCLELIKKIPWVYGGSYLVHRSTFCRRLPPGQGVPLCLTSSTFYRGSSHSSRRCHFRSCWRRFRLGSWTGRTRVTHWEGGAGRGQRRRQRRRNWKARRELRNKNKNLVTLKCNNLSLASRFDFFVKQRPLAFTNQKVTSSVSPKLSQAFAYVLS